MMVFSLSLHTKANSYETKKISLHYNRNDFTYHFDEDSCVLVTTDKYFYAFGSDSYSPALPLISINVLIGDNDEYSEFSCNVVESVLMSNIRMLPNPTCVTTNQFYDHEKRHEEVKYSQAEYPQFPVKYVGTHMVDGYRMLGFLVIPLKYDAINGVLLINDTIDLEIKLGKRIHKEKPSHSSNPMVIENVRLMVVNKDDIYRLYDLKDISGNRRESSNNNDKSYIVVTNDSLKPFFEPLINWKTRKGIKACVETTEHIDSIINDTISLQLKIKRYLKMCKDSFHTNFVLLGGDDSVVPAQMCYGRYRAKDNSGIVRIYEEYTPTDLFYACFGEPFNWNRNGNEKIGEKEDSIDLSQSIVLTRIPVRSISDVKAFVSKQLMYEINPPIENWNNTFLMVGCIIDNYFNQNNEIISDAQKFSEIMYANHIENKGWTGNKKRFYDTGTDFSVNPPYILNPQNLQTQLSNGYSFVNICTHGSQTSIGLDNYTYYERDSAGTLINHQPSIIVTDACNTNAFDSSVGFNNDPCLSESFLRNPKSGVIAYLGSSREGLFSIFDGGTSMEFVSTFYDKLFQEADYQGFGKIVNSMRYVFINDCYEDNHRWIMFGFNPMGDPEMPIYISQPKVFNEVDFNFNSENHSLRITPNLNNNQVYNISLNGYSDSYFDEEHRLESYIEFNGVPDDVWVCLTSYGYIPYQVRLCSGEMMIQNESLYDRQLFNANKIRIGSNITTSREFGPVIVKGENVVVKATSDVFIKNDFEVKKGASFTITSNN